MEQWVASNPPPKWPPFPNWKRPHERKKEREEDVSSAEYLAGLHAKTFAALEGSISCMMNGNERFVRDSNMRMAETLEVAALVTPRIAVKEQILEEALRQVQVCLCECARMCVAGVVGGCRVSLLMKGRSKVFLRILGRAREG